MQAPHILVAIFARGLIKQLVTRIYFPGDDHAADHVMLQIPVERRATLIAKVIEDQPGVLEWNIAIGGGVHETVFFEL
jgi:protocatechuate 3,4-dioxygenase alpha subunit